jgi:hypothetical protein
MTRLGNHSLRADVQTVRHSAARAHPFGASVRSRPALESQAQQHQPIAAKQYQPTNHQVVRTARPRPQRIRHHVTAKHTEAETTLVLGALTVAGIDYRSVGDLSLALSAAAKAREHRKKRREEHRMTPI